MPGMAELAGHPDRERWNARYEGRDPVSFEPHPVAVRALSLGLPEGPVADLACGTGGSALLAAAAGRRVTAVDISDVALGLLAEEASRRGLGDLITVVQADLGAWCPEPGGYALVLCTGYWDRAVFAAAAGAVAAGGIVGWESLTAEARRGRPTDAVGRQRAQRLAQRGPLAQGVGQPVQLVSQPHHSGDSSSWSGSWVRSPAPRVRQRSPGRSVAATAWRSSSHPAT